MAQVRNTFVKSKMNRDLDARLLPNGEYREGRNINVSRSEGADVGALENVLGNAQGFDVTAWLSKNITGVSGSPRHMEIIGMFPDLSTSALYVFATNYTDSSPNTLACHAKRAGTANTNAHWIFQLLVDKNGDIEVIPLVTGSFLNFSKTHRIMGCDVIEGLLFWTDNRNQPRKINLENAKSSLPAFTPTYYTAEEQIAVAKYYPYQGIEFVKKIGSNYISTLVDEVSEYLPYSLIAGINAIGTNVNLTDNTADALLFTGTPASGVEWDATADISGFVTKAVGSGKKVRITNFSRPDTDPVMATQILGLADNAVGVGTSMALQQSITAIRPSWTEGDVVGFQIGNPDYNPNFAGDKDFLKEKFARFSYRFQYDDNEYSLMAPFTQPAFLPKQYGSIGVGDEDKTKMETILNFFENTITTIGLVITLPYNHDVLKDSLKVKNLQILIKTSDNPNVEVVKEIPIEDIEGSDYIPNGALKKQFVYEYRSNKPWKTLPEKDILRVNDIIPTRALAQASSGNRIIYGNFTNRPSSPEALNYEIIANDKNGTAITPVPTTTNNLIKEYYNHTLKQGRSYQVGVVLSDKYGRQSNVILAKNDALTINTPYAGSSTYAGYTNGGPDPLDWFGNSLKINWIDEIPESITTLPGYPGLYNVNTNPLGWYSYKVVVKQQEQEYYNIYVAGAVSGDITYKNPRLPLAYSNATERSKIALFGDNINKIPRDLNNTGPMDVAFGSEVKLVGRVIQNVYLSSNVHNNIQTTAGGAWDNVISIEPFKDLGDWTKYKGVITYDGAGTADGAFVYPGSNPNPASPIVGTTDPFINTDNNPYIATINTTGVKATGENRVGFAPGSYDAGTHATDGQVAGTFAKKLMVFETKPVESKLDIYWETTTSGLISDLNTSIKNNVGALDVYGLSDFIFQQNEAFTFNTDILGANLIPTNKAGTILTDQNCTMSILGVYAGTGRNVNTSVNLKDNYEIYIKVPSSGVGVPPQFMIRTAAAGTGQDFVYLNNAPLETYTFHLQVNQTIPTAITKTFVIGNNRLANYKPLYTGTNPSPTLPSAPSNYVEYVEGSSVGARIWKGPVFDNNGYSRNAIPDVASINAINSSSRITQSGAGGWILNDFTNGSAKGSSASVQPYVSKIEWYDQAGVLQGEVDKYNGDNWPLGQVYNLDATWVQDQGSAPFFTSTNPNNPFPVLIPGPGVKCFPFYIKQINGNWCLQINEEYPPSYNVAPWSNPVNGGITYGVWSYNLLGGSKAGYNVPSGQSWLAFKIHIGLKELFTGGIDNESALTVWFRLRKKA